MGSIVSSPTTITVQNPPPPGTYALSVLAASMSSGQWAQMSPTPTGLMNFIGGPTSGIKTFYAGKMAYDPAGRRIYWIGCDHADNQTFVQYDEATNAWTVNPITPFAAPTKHGYDHTTWDNLHNRLYHRPYGTRGVFRWDGGSTWSFTDYSSHLGYSSAANGCEFFPTLGANGTIVVFQVENGTDGKIIGIDPVTGTKTTYASGATLAGTGDPHNFALYNPVSGVVLFGSGNGSNKVWTINSSGTVAAKTNIPAAIGAIGPAGGMGRIFAHPTNGKFIVLRSSTVWYEFDPTGAGTWTPKGGTATMLSSNLFDSSDPVNGTIGVTLRQYGVIVFIKGYSRSQPAEMWVYKP